jgi:VIT1/CCC1 family predicted Fe2+/Mn2+ transporter
MFRKNRSERKREADSLKPRVQKAILCAQRNEITEVYIYQRLARSVKDSHNREVLERISKDELRHYDFWKEHTRRDVKPHTLKVWWYYLIARAFGLTFGIKLMERGEGRAEVNYRDIAAFVPGAERIAIEEDEHEKELIEMIDEERMKYTGAIVRGLNDALVELTGALAGLTFAFAQPRLIAVAGLITGVSASLSMAGSEYLATKTGPGGLSPGKASLYTGLAYIFTVFVLILPYFVFDNLYLSLGLLLLAAILIISVFNFYYAVAKDIPFCKRFFEMAGISLGIAVFSFGIGTVIRKFLPVEI